MAGNNYKLAPSSSRVNSTLMAFAANFQRRQHVQSRAPPSPKMNGRPRCGGWLDNRRVQGAAHLDPRRGNLVRVVVVVVPTGTGPHRLPRPLRHVMWQLSRLHGFAEDSAALLRLDPAWVQNDRARRKAVSGGTFGRAFERCRTGFWTLR